MKAAHRDFERLVAQYERRLYNVALRIAGDPDVAAELTQDTFLRAFRAWEKFRNESQAYTWLYRILINLNKDRLAREARRRGREVPILSQDGSESEWEIADGGPQPEKAAEMAELRGVLTAAIENLPAGYKECVVLKDVEALSYEEIASVMGITVEAVRSRLARARQQLRQRLGPYLKT